MRSFAGRRKKTRDLSGYSTEELKEYYKNRMLYYLSRRKTAQEVRKYLLSLGCEEDMAEELMQFSEEYHFTDDEEYARSFIRDSSRIKLHSMKRIRYDLQQKGVDRVVVDRIMEEESISDEEAAISLIQKKLKDPNDEEARKKCGAYLQSHGFSYDTIERAFRKIQ
ncbi:MAG: regulatory protein RecX [Firmicutes bacterium]|nr:regulatory protein RecX [Bacillota bacterium]